MPTCGKPLEPEARVWPSFPRERRSAPRTGSESLAVIPKGATVAAGDCRGGWCRVSWNGQAGYAQDSDLGAAPPLWPQVAAAAWVPDRTSSQKTGWTALGGPARARDDTTGRERNEDGFP